MWDMCLPLFQNYSLYPVASSFSKNVSTFSSGVTKWQKNSVKHHHIPIEPLCLNLFKLSDVFSQVVYTNFVKFMSFKLCHLHLPVKKFNRQRNITHLIQAIFLWNLYITQTERGIRGGVVKGIIDCGRLKLLLISWFTFCGCMNFNKLLILLIEKPF